MTSTRLVLTLIRPMTFSVGILAAISLGGYVFSLEILYRPLPNGPASHPLTILSALLLAIAIAEYHRSHIRSEVLAWVVAILCVLRLAPGSTAEGIYSVLTPFHAMVTHDRQLGLRNSMGVNTALMFLFISSSILLLRRRWLHTSQIFAFISLAMPMVAITGYAYGLPKFYGEMSLVTITYGLPLGLTAAALSANRAMLRVILAPYITGRIARIQIALGYIIPFMLGFLFLKALQSNGETNLFGVFVIAISWFIILLITISSVVHERIDHIRRLHERALARSALIDPLTGIFNRRKFDSCFDAEVQRSRRGGTPLSLIMIDIDFFKMVNDTGGHPMGDLVLKTVARTVKNHIRTTDTLGRLGGEEFAIILPDTTVEGVAYVAESLRRIIESTNFAPWPNHDGRITASLGCTTWVMGDTETSMLRRADTALYNAKAAGRNQIAVLNATPELITST